MASKTSPKFERVNKPAPSEKDDEEGRVTVAVFLSKGGKRDTSNISKQLTIKDATVSEVFAAIETALIGDSDNDD